MSLKSWLIKKLGSGRKGQSSGFTVDGAWDTALVQPERLRPGNIPHDFQERVDTTTVKKIMCSGELSITIQLHEVFDKRRPEHVAIRCRQMDRPFVQCELTQSHKGELSQLTISMNANAPSATDSAASGRAPHVEIHLLADQLFELVATGTASVEIIGVSRKIAILAQETVSVKVAAERAKVISLSVQESARIEATGEVHSLHVFSSGTSFVDTSELNASIAHIRATQNSEVRVLASERLDIQATAAAEVRHDGNAVVTKVQEGLAKIRPLKMLGRYESN